MTAAIVAPMCAYTLFLFGIWALLGYVRFSGTFRGVIPAEYLRVGQGPLPPARIVDVHHHFSNQFEIPVLFYLGCIASLAAESVDRATVTLAWSFVGLRVLHTMIVLVRNDPRLRVAPYVLSTLVVWAIPVRQLARAEPFYREVLGFEVGLRDETRPWVFLRAGGMAGMVVLQECSGECPTLHFAFAVDPADLESAAAALRERGVSTQGPIFHEWIPGKSLYFRDPDGHDLELFAPATRG